MINPSADILADIPEGMTCLPLAASCLFGENRNKIDRGFKAHSTYHVKTHAPRAEGAGGGYS